MQCSKEHPSLNLDVDHKLELGRLFDGEVGGFCTLVGPALEDTVSFVQWCDWRHRCVDWSRKRIEEVSAKDSWPHRVRRGREGRCRVVAGPKAGGRSVQGRRRRTQVAHLLTARPPSKKAG